MSSQRYDDSNDEPDSTEVIFVFLLNFSHPLTPAQLAQLEALTGAGVERVVTVPTQFDTQQPFVPQVEAMLAQVPLTADEWQTAPLRLCRRR